ncbi:putative DNA-directed DNA polymerase [Rosa chinensis]|uniref:Putative DNA-directed DNA polymerase n=1 Tax=Rosa chinensis TaxID=74649 RepID=A0A2P6RQI5_ROSCH|nr:putative DNA-directed DNA polymerase [Rosa chinensis]
MFVRDAKALCPHLVILPYDFEAYEEVTNRFYDILHKHCRKVQAVSCDEAFLDVTYLEGVDMDMLASIIIQEIFETTGCIASAGIARNMLMARLTTRTAKPDGQCNIPPKRCNMQEGMEGNPFAKTMKTVSRGMAVLTVPFTMEFPKSVG